MKATVVKIGNSRGIRIPKPVFEQCGFGAEVDLEVDNQKLIIRSANQPRKGWAKAFQAMAERGDDALLEHDTEAGSTWDEEEWEWK